MIFKVTKVPLISVSLSWIAGVFLGSIFNFPFWLLFLGIIPFLLLSFPRRHRKLVVLPGICAILFISGGLYFQWRLPVNDEHHLQFYNDNGMIEINGMVIRDPESTDKALQLLVSVSSINASGNKVTGKVLVLVPRAAANADYAYGDLLQIKGRLETPTSVSDFDYKGYLANQGIYSVMYYPRLTIVDKSRGFKPLEVIYQVRERLSHSLTSTLPEPQSSLAQGIILGQRGSIPADVEDRFIRTGTAHLLAISGVNLTIMAGILVSVGIAIFGRRYRLYAWLAIIAIWLYSLMTGLQSPVTRAAIMASMFLASELLGRQRSSAASLILAVTLMVTFSPQIIYDASFQLSAMAMAGLVFVAPPLQSLSKQGIEAALPVRLAGIVAPIADSFIVSVGSIIAIWPLIAFYFGIVSWIGPLATVLTVAAMPPIIIAGSLCGILGIFWLPLAQAVAWIVWLFLSYVLMVVKVADYVPSGEVILFPYQWIFAYYAVLASVIWAYNHRIDLLKSLERFTDFAIRLPLKRITTSLFLSTVLIFIAAGTMPDNKMHIAFLDVGQGDAILISQGSQQILIDGGPSGEAIISQLSSRMPFWDRTIDLIISTHPHADHLSGLAEVITRYRVNQVLYADILYEAPHVSKWKSLISSKNIPSVKAQAGQQIVFGGASIKVLNPQPVLLSGTDSDIDNNAIIIRLTKGKINFLFMSDARQEVERQLISQRSLIPSNVLKVGHHGSATSTTDSLLSIVNPDTAVISVGIDNKFGHPDKDVATRLTDKVGQERVFRTDKHGTIEFTTDGNRLWVMSDR